MGIGIASEHDNAAVWISFQLCGQRAREKRSCGKA
jgi:hypothetical protein